MKTCRGVNATVEERPEVAPLLPPIFLAYFLAVLADSFCFCADACKRKQPGGTQPSIQLWHAKAVLYLPLYCPEYNATEVSSRGI